MAKEVPEANEEMNPEDFEKLLMLAEDGNIHAQFEVGLALRNGWGADRDGEEAFQWMLKAAQNKDAQAMCTLGHMFFIGDCCEKDYAKAKTWFSSAVVYGFPECAVAVNELYIAEALEADDLKQAREQLKVREKVWNKPLSDPRLVFRIVEQFCQKLQAAIAEKLSEFPAAGVSLKITNKGTYWYQIDLPSDPLKAAIFEYCLNDEPPFLAIAFYASNQGLKPEEAMPVLEKFNNDLRIQYNPKTFGFAVIQPMDLEGFLDQKLLAKLSREAVKIHKMTTRAAKALIKIVQ